MQRHLRNFVDQESGATAVEYGLILAIIGGVLLLALPTIGPRLAAVFTLLGTVIASGSA